MGLLEHLTNLLGCQYLSDLPMAANTPKQADQILSLSEEQFTVQDFREAAQYITRSKEDFLTAALAKEAIVRHLLENASRE